MLAPLPSEVLALLATQRSVITRRQLLAHAVSDRVIHRLRTTGVLIRLRPGVYAERLAFNDAAFDEQHCMRLLAAQLQAADAVADGPSAATACGLPLLRTPPQPQVIRSSAASPLSGVTVTRSHIITPTSRWATVHDGIRMTVMAKTAIDVAAQVPFAEALGTVDAVLRRGVQPAELQEALRVVPPISGVGAARLAVSFGDPYAETWLESTSRGRMLERKMPLPLSNVEIHWGRRWARADFLLAEQGVIGEADGTGKYRGTERPPEVVILKERERQGSLEDLGFAVARWGIEHVSGRADVMVHRMEAAGRRARNSQFRWPNGVVAKVPLLDGAPPPERVVREVERLAAAGLPIWFVDARGRRVHLRPRAA